MDSQVESLLIEMKRVPILFNLYFVVPLSESVSTTFMKVFNIEASTERICLKASDPQPKFYVTAFAGISAPCFNVSVCFLFPEEVFEKLAESWPSSAFDNESISKTMIIDALVNMILSQAFESWNDQQRKFSITNITVAFGESIRTHHCDQAIVIPYSTKFGDFHVEICAKED